MFFITKINRYFLNGTTFKEIHHFFRDITGKITKVRFKCIGERGSLNVFRLDQRSLRYMKNVVVNEIKQRQASEVMFTQGYSKNR